MHSIKVATKLSAAHKLSHRTLPSHYQTYLKRTNDRSTSSTFPVMQKIINSIKPTKDKDLPIIVAQYKRDVYGHGTEERLHWAIICLKSSHDQEGPCFQAVDRRYSDGRENPV